MALADGGDVDPIADSGSCMRVGDGRMGRSRPRGPSGDDCMELFVGLDVKEGTLVLTAETGVGVQGTEVIAGSAVEIRANDGDALGTLHAAPLARVSEVAMDEVIV